MTIAPKPMIDMSRVGVKLPETGTFGVAAGVAVIFGVAVGVDFGVLVGVPDGVETKAGPSAA